MTDLPNNVVLQLLNQIASGDDKAFKALYSYYQPSLASFVRNKVIDESSIEEIVNDTFMTLCKNCNFNGSSKFSTWLCAIAKRRCIDLYNKSKNSIQTEDVEIEMIHAVSDDSESLLQILEHKERDEILRECIRKLPAEQNEAITLALFNEDNIDEIAKRQACPSNTVKTRLFHARIKITECVRNALGIGA